MHDAIPSIHLVVGTIMTMSVTLHTKRQTELVGHLVRGGLAHDAVPSAHLVRSLPGTYLTTDWVGRTHGTK